MNRFSLVIGVALLAGAFAAQALVAAPSEFGEALPQFGGSGEGKDLPGLRPPPPERPAKRAEVGIENRLWTDVYGRQVTAKFVRVFNGNVTLSRSGRMVVLRYYDLTAYDQSYVKEILTARGEEALIPPPLPVVQPTDPNAAAPGEQNGFVSRTPTPPAEPRTFVPKGASELFAEMKDRDRELREKQAEHVAAMAAQTREVAGESAETSGDPAREAANASTPAPKPAEGTTASNSLASGQVTAMVLAGIVVAGVVGIVAVIVFAATTIASASSISRHREYR